MRLVSTKCFDVSSWLTLLLPLAAKSSLDIPTKLIAPSISMPVVSIGTWTEGTSKADQNIASIVGNWLQLGGRGIDTAWIYFDQQDISEVLADFNISRQEIFITSKLPTCLGASLTQYFLERNLRELRTDYIDLMLIHAPGFPFFGCDSTWRVLEDYVANGKLKSIGVSNWEPDDFRALTYKIPPAVNQVQFHLFLHDDDTEDYCKENNITVEAYSPLGGYSARISHRSIFFDPVTTSIAEKHNVSAAQVALRWIVQKGHTLTFLSSDKLHQATSADIFGFNLDEEDMISLNSLNTWEKGADTTLGMKRSLRILLMTIMVLCFLLCVCSASCFYRCYLQRNRTSAHNSDVVQKLLGTSE